MTALVDEVRLALGLPPPAVARKIRMQAGVSQERFAAELDVHPITIARWERGARTPRGDLRVKYARLLGVLDDLVTRAERARAWEAS